MLCCAMLCYAMLCYAMLCYAVLCYAMLCYAMLCYAMLELNYNSLNIVSSFQGVGDFRTDYSPVYNSKKQNNLQSEQNYFHSFHPNIHTGHTCTSMLPCVTYMTWQALVHCHTTT